ncbi:MAG: ATP synthase subunit I [Defluviitaleaceae bacterium]|nr:ATP synthase subunit I [Defluviitaleaceae bacterium]
MDYTVDSFVRKMLIAVVIISILMMAGGAVFFRSSFAVGFALGIGISMVLNLVKIVWLKHCVTRATSMESAKGGAYVSIHYILRFILTGLVITATHFLPVVDMFGAAIGLLSMPFANYVVHFFGRRNVVNGDKHEL